MLKKLINELKSRTTLTTGQRSAGRHIRGPVWASWEHHDYREYGIKPRYINLTVGNPKVHYRWAFSFYFYYSWGK